MKTPASFKLSKSTKRFLACIDNKASRAEVRKLFIDAEYTKAIMANRRVREKTVNND
jgi:hypothetical protein